MTNDGGELSRSAKELGIRDTKRLFSFFYFFFRLDLAFEPFVIIILFGLNFFRKCSTGLALRDETKKRLRRRPVLHGPTKLSGIKRDISPN